MKTLRKKEKEKIDFKIPHSVQDTIPVNKIYKDGVFLIGKDKYSKIFKFTDINYAVASKPDKEAMFLNYGELLNSLDSGATTKITILNRKLNKVDFEENVLIPMNKDKLDKYRKEYNDMLLDKTINSNSMIQEKFLTITVQKKNYEEAKNYFSRIYIE